MLQSKLFYRTTKNKTAGADSVSHDLLVRGGFIDQLMAGVYTFLPLGLLVLRKIEKIIRDEMVAAGGQEILMPVLQPRENWMKTGRWENLEILFKLKGSGDKEYALGPTHEEILAPLAKKVIFSYRDLPFAIFQIQTKFRDELRAKSGILRTREFLMKDMYSLHANEKDLQTYYEKMAQSYEKIFKECGISRLVYRALASGGSFSKYSDEFQMVTEAGEDIIYICKKCRTAINKEIKKENPKCPKCAFAEFEEKKAIEVGNIFKLGAKFSSPFDLKFTDRDGEDKMVIMGCYGIGLGRLMGAIAQANNDGRGIIWPKSVSPFLAHLIQIENKPEVKKASQEIYEGLNKRNIAVLYDDRTDKSVGEKFAEADLIGISSRIVVSVKTLQKNSVEIKERGEEKAYLVKINKLAEIF